eukprot:scaffold274817_cov23-Tisochrysis_lutea.AAC.1
MKAYGNHLKQASYKTFFPTWLTQFCCTLECQHWRSINTGEANVEKQHVHVNAPGACRRPALPSQSFLLPLLSSHPKLFMACINYSQSQAAGAVFAAGLCTPCNPDPFRVFHVPILLCQSQAAGADDDGAPQQQNGGCNGDEVEDSDSWMEAQGAVVEQELAKRQAEMEGGPLGHGQKGNKKRGPK